MPAGISWAVALSEGRFFTKFLTVSSETNWKENFLFILTFLLYFKYTCMSGKFGYYLFNLIVTIHRFTVTDSEFVLKVLAILLFSEKILSFSINVILEPPYECLSEKYGL